MKMMTSQTQKKTTTSDRVLHKQNKRRQQAMAHRCSIDNDGKKKESFAKKKSVTWVEEQGRWEYFF
jgi:hypothetical protein